MTEMNGRDVKISVIIPTHKGAAELEKLLAFIYKNNSIHEIIVVDTRSEVDNGEIAAKYGAIFIQIEKEEFDHGYVRTLGGRKATGDILVYLTQDSIPADVKSIRRLVSPLVKNRKVAVSYGRQLPCANATPFAAHLRYFNYTPEHELKSFDDRLKQGIKTVFISNSFSAYRKTALEDIGWFKTGLLLGEDFHAGAILLEKGYLISYTADAEVFHSHNYSMKQEFRRYFDIGVVHRKESWILKKFGKPEKEGFKFVISEISYMFRIGKFYLVPHSLMRALVKFFGYKLGYSYTMLPRPVINMCTMGKSEKAGIYD